MFTHLILRAVTGDHGHKEIVLEDGRSYVIGRASDCDIRLSSPNVSRHHCQLVVHSPSVYLRDLGSLNGTLLNGKIIGHRDCGIFPEEGDSLHESHVVADGDVLRIGDNLFWIDFGCPWEEETREADQKTEMNGVCPVCG